MHLIEAPPERQPFVQEPKISYRNPVKVNYFEAEQANRLTGTSGERMMISAITRPSNSEAISDS